MGRLGTGGAVLKDTLDNRPDLQSYLFIRGYLITDDDLTARRNAFPFYSNWDMVQLGIFQIWTHKLQKIYYLHHAGVTFFLIGHAYNPFTMEHEETRILDAVAKSFVQGKCDYLEAINELTGLFITGYVDDRDITFLLDCSGMQYGCYGEIDGHLYIASHMQLVGDLRNLDMDPFVQELTSYRWYRYMMGNYLPGDLTAFTQIKRIIPNTLVHRTGGTLGVQRFYPNQPIAMCQNESEYADVITRAATIMQNNMVLIARKWEKPAISLTGGIDSNTTFAAANGVYDKYSTFTYVSMPREAVDSAAAQHISETFNVMHTVYQVPDANEAIPDFDIYKQILSHNDGDIGPTKDNDTRKKIVLMQCADCDVEVKSWISETIRAYAYKYFGRRRMPRVLGPRHYTSLYKIFLLNRRLVWQTDRHFKKYIEDTHLREHLFNYDQSDFFVWEMMHGGKCGLNIGTMKFCFDITIPYNNRKLLDLLLRVSLRDRIDDRHHLDLKKLMNQQLFDMNIRIVNQNESDMRKRLINLYFTINTMSPI